MTQRARAKRSPRLDLGTHRSLRSAISGVLRERLMQGSLSPGQPISVKDLHRDFRVGPSAVREALWQLVVAGFVTVEDQHGFRAAPVSEADLADLTRARVEIETFAIRDAIAHGDVQWEARIAAEFHKLSLLRDDGYHLQHRAFHDALVAGCTSQWMLRFLSMVHEHSARYRQLAVSYEVHERDVMEEHRAIVEATLARDADRAAALIAAHVHETSRVFRRLVVAEGASPGHDRNSTTA